MQEEFRAMRAAMERNETRQEERDRINSEKRSELYKAVEKTNSEVAELKHVAEQALYTAQSAKRVTDRVEDWEQRGRGVLFLLGIGSASLAGGAVYFFDSVIAWLKLRMGL